MDEIKPPMRLFLPSQCLMEDSGLLLGWHDVETHSACVTAILPVHHVTQSENVADDIIGIWDNEFCESTFDSKDVNALLESHKSWIYMHKWDSELPECSGSHSHQRMGTQDIIVIVYDSMALWETLIDLRQNSEGILPILMQAMEKHKCKLWNIPTVKSFIPHKSSLYSRFVDRLLLTFTTLFIGFLSITSFISSSRIFRSQSFCKLLCVPSAFGQVHRKWMDVKSTVTHFSSCSTSPSDNSQLRLRNTLVRVFMDVALGMIAMHFALSGGITSLLASAVMQWAQQVAQHLQALLHWMMGAPAGLKLNEELAHFLGQFFLYHIYLWTGYLQFLTTVWGDLIYYITLSGWLGLSVQLALAQDLFSMMTLHIYCFYVYAARLYNLQVCALSSLWRLFRGKKWNVLRGRVDSAEYDVDQLFVGTLLFTIFLFLLPTTTLFYVVFATLRVVVLLLQGAVHHLISLINHSALYLLVLRIIFPDSVRGEIQFHALKSANGRPTFLAMELVPVSLSALLEPASPLKQTTVFTSGDTWGMLLKNLLSGNLIYPWINNGKASSDKIKQQ